MTPLQIKEPIISALKFNQVGSVLVLVYMRNDELRIYTFNYRFLFFVSYGSRDVYLFLFLFF